MYHTKCTLSRLRSEIDEQEHSSHTNILEAHLHSDYTEYSWSTFFDRMIQLRFCGIDLPGRAVAQCALHNSNIQMHVIIVGVRVRWTVSVRKNLLSSLGVARVSYKTHWHIHIACHLNGLIVYTAHLLPAYTKKKSTENTTHYMTSYSLLWVWVLSFRFELRSNIEICVHEVRHKSISFRRSSCLPGIAYYIRIQTAHSHERAAGDKSMFEAYEQ